MTHEEWSALKEGTTLQSTKDKSVVRIEGFGALGEKIGVKLINGQPVKSLVIRDHPRLWKRV